jgi:hypothetical protein
MTKADAMDLAHIVDYPRTSRRERRERRAALRLLEDAGWIEPAERVPWWC